METRVTAVTVNVAEPLIVPEVAVIVADPGAMVVAKPLPLMVAIEVAEDVQVAVPVRFLVVPLLYVPVAVNCCVFPTASEGAAGVTAMEVNTAAETVRVAVPLILEEVAVIVTVPGATPFANPV